MFKQLTAVALLTLLNLTSTQVFAQGYDPKWNPNQLYNNYGNNNNSNYNQPAYNNQYNNNQQYNGQYNNNQPGHYMGKGPAQRFMGPKPVGNVNNLVQMLQADFPLRGRPGADEAELFGLPSLAKVAGGNMQKRQFRSPY